ncbi:hypothetical protein F2Q69_00032886 [Brassica cretica]|uniref:Uncharacterized protein n=1 Tax=Brassica cretica TaxID=69181 RepID=A0A8S9SIR1_BRACR|nr:hypothetical protein F2Q69_00032886 [Brassica cretica]
MKVFHLDRENTPSVSLFSDVTNSKELLSSILDGTLKLEMEEVAKLINGKEIDLEELKTHANQAHMLKDSPPFSFVNLYNILIQVLISKVDSFQHYKITNQELGISSLGDAIVCRISARNAL